MARAIGPDVPEDQRYSDDQIKEFRETIADMLEPEKKGSKCRALGFVGDLHGNEFYEMVEKLQEDETQFLLKYFNKNTTLPEYIVKFDNSKKDYSFNEQLEIIQDQTNIINNQIETIKYLINIKAIDTNGYANENLVIDYINKIDLKKVAGYRKQSMIKFERGVQEIERNNQISPEDLHRPLK